MLEKYKCIYNLIRVYKESIFYIKSNQHEAVCNYKVLFRQKKYQLTA